MRLKFERIDLKKMYERITSKFSLKGLAIMSTFLLASLFSSYTIVHTRTLEKRINEMKKKIEEFEVQRKDVVSRCSFDSWGFIDTLRMKDVEIQLGDIDYDGDMDIITKDKAGTIWTYENTMPQKFLPQEERLLCEITLKMKAVGYDIAPLLKDKKFKYYRDIRNLLYSGREISKEQHQKNLEVYVKKYLDEAADFMMQNRVWLSKAQLKYGIAPWDIVSLLNQETRLGKARGNRSIFNSLISVLLTFPKKEKFVYRNLKALLELSKQENKEVFSYKGSFMGAYEWPQSLPENISKFGVDFDDDGKIDLSTLPDAIGFIANYLAQAGYKKDRYGAFYAYNPSNIYCDYLIALGDALETEYNKRQKRFGILLLRECPKSQAERDKTSILAPALTLTSMSLDSLAR
ncbi:MAG: lytic murein transglycosylase [Candidatus Pacearchaeota archaeon]|nr:lytic murein transglycosylase [Candidatus Pacearchaeota archaeon]